MGAITPTYPLGARGTNATELAGANRLFIFAIVPASASDTVTLVRATDKITTIIDAFAVLQTGQDANLTSCHVTFSGLVITIVTIGANGLAATDWTSATATLWVIGQ